MKRSIWRCLAIISLITVICNGCSNDGEESSHAHEITFHTPSVSTTSASGITSTTATSGGNISSDGNAPVTERGVCWNTSTNPTRTNSKTSDGTGIGNFATSITGLVKNTKYYVRAYATNSVGTGYGNEITFTTSGGPK